MTLGRHLDLLLKFLGEHRCVQIFEAAVDEALPVLVVGGWVAQDLGVLERRIRRSEQKLELRHAAEL